MTLGEAQQIFTRNIGLLIGYVYSHGYALTFGEALRTPEMVAIYAANGKGSATSLHPDRLAVDFNLFRDGQYMARTEDWEAFGAYWKDLHPSNRWGGDFKSRPDGNHFSFAWQGRA